jgi:hypothetical protein
MPNFPPPNDHDLPEDEQLAKRRQRQEEKAATSKRLQDIAELQHRQSFITLHAEQAGGAKGKRTVKETKLYKHEKHSPTFANSGPRETLKHGLFVLGAIATISINYFVINAPAHYLASLPFTDENAWQVGFSTILIPVALLVFELCISLARKTAREEESPYVYVWNLIGFVMVLIPPTMIIGAMLVRPEWNAAYNLATSLGMILFAVGTDAYIIFGGEYIFIALSFIWFKYFYSHLQAAINRADRQYRAHRRAVESAWIPFAQAYNDYTAQYPNFPLNLPFSKEVREFVNEIYPGAIAEPAPLPPPPENPPPTLTISAPRPPQNPPPPALAETPNSESEPNAEVEYLQNLIRTRVRSQERTVQAD